MPDPPENPPSVSPSARAHAWAVHLFTASGVACAFLALSEGFRATPDPRWACGWLMLAVLIDALDGPWARRVDVRAKLPHVRGRTIDDLVDYLTFTFVPLVLVARFGWVLEPAGPFVVAAMMASLLGFANAEAKQEREGFFRGFPSYWNVFFFYAGPWVTWSGPLGPTIALVLLTVLTLAPVRFLYPNLAPHPWRPWLLAGGYLWLAALLALLPAYPDVDRAAYLATLAYPAFYVVLSRVLDRRARRAGPCRG